MSLRVIITGSTGMVGKGCLLECMDSTEVEAILLVNRNSVKIKHSKVKEVLVKDFHNLSPVLEYLKDYNACFFCLGVTSAGMKEAEYSKIMYDLPVNFAKEVYDQNPDLIFCFVSGAGTDSTEKGNIMWARVKGKAENAILKMGFKRAFMFRPGYIQPSRGIRSRTRWYNAFIVILSPFYFLIKKLPKYVTDSDTLAKSMIHVSIHGYDKNILESSDINLTGRTAIK